MDWVKNKNFVNHEEKIEKMKQRILVKEDKPSNCYTYCHLLDDLHNRPAEEVAKSIKGKPENLGCKTGYELIFEATTRFNCIKSFRDGIAELDKNSPGYLGAIH